MKGYAKSCNSKEMNRSNEGKVEEAVLKTVLVIT